MIKQLSLFSKAKKLEDWPCDNCKNKNTGESKLSLYLNLKRPTQQPNKRLCLLGKFSIYTNIPLSNNAHHQRWDRFERFQILRNG